MIDGYVIDWSAVAACIAAVAAIAAAYFSYLSARHRANLDAALEISRLRERNLSEFKELASDLLPIIFQDGGFQVIQKEKVAPTVSKMLLVLSPSNSKHEAMSKKLLELIKTKRGEDQVGTVLSRGGKDFEDLLEVSRCYVLEERKQVEIIMKLNENA